MTEAQAAELIVLVGDLGRIAAAAVGLWLAERFFFYVGGILRR